MKISNSIPSVGGVQDSALTRSPAAVTPQGGTLSTERVDISALSSRLLEVGAGEAPLNVERVAEIKQAIAAGRFQINPERIADGLLTSVREMLAAKH